MRVWSWPAKLKSQPTAQASVGERTDTEVSALNSLPGLGVGNTVQAVPSQCAASVVAVPPTAQTSSGELADNAIGPVPSGRLGPGSMLHFLPFQCRSSECPTLL